MEQTLAAISRLRKNKQPINFVRSRPLRRFRLHGYIKEEGIRREIERQRGRSQSSAIQPPRLARSKDNIIAALRLRAKALQGRESRFETRTENSLRKVCCTRIRMQAFRGRKLG